jgi:hypothetical protein
MRKIMLGALGAIAIAIIGQGTSFAAEEDVTAATTPQTVSSTTITRPTQLTTSGPYTPAGTARDTNLSNQNHSAD